MQASTERLLRRKLAEDMAESDFTFGIVKFCAGFAAFLFIVMCLMRLTQSPLQQPAPQAHQHHKGSPHK